jgi:hypothetical protein
MKRIALFYMVLFACSKSKSEDTNLGDTHTGQEESGDSNSDSGTTVSFPPLEDDAFEWYEANRVQAHTARHVTHPLFAEQGARLTDLGVGAFLARCNRNAGPCWPSEAPNQDPDAVELAQSLRDNGLLAEGENLLSFIAKEANTATADKPAQGIMIYALHTHETYYGGVSNDENGDDLVHTSDETWDYDPNDPKDLNRVPHPEWACQDFNRDILIKPGTSGNLWQCINNYTDVPDQASTNGGYREVTLTRMKEMAAAGIDGIYFDDTHNPPLGCYCEHCRVRWTEVYGEQVPFPADATSGATGQTAAEMRAMIDFYNDSVEGFFQYLVDEVHKEFPDFFVLIASGYLQSTGMRGMNTRLGAIGDGLKGESKRGARSGDLKAQWANVRGVAMGLKYPSADMLMAVGWAIQRDAANGRPPHIWTHDLLDESQALAFSAGMATYGAINNINRDLDLPFWVDNPADPDGPQIINPDSGIPQSWTASSFDLGNRIAQHIKYRRVPKWAGLYYSEEFLDNLTGDNGYSPRENNSNFHPELWQYHLGGLFGAAETLTERGGAWHIVNDSQLQSADLSGYKTLIVPLDEDRLSDWQRQSLADFTGAGGHVVYIGKGLGWWNKEAARTSLGDQLWAEITQVIGPPEIAVSDQRTDKSNRVHSNVFLREGSNRVLALIANDFRWVVNQYDINGVETPVSSTLAPAPVPANSFSLKLDGSAITSAPVAAFELINGDTPIALPIVETDSGYEVVLDQPFEHMAAIVVQFAHDNPDEVALKLE